MRTRDKRLDGARLAAVAALAASLGAAATARAQDVGELVVKSKPPGAAVSIDGKAAGTAPVTKAGLSVGKHSVDAVWPDGKKVHSRGKVVANGSVTVWVKPRGEAEAEAETSAPVAAPAVGTTQPAPVAVAETGTTLAPTAEASGTSAPPAMAPSAAAQEAPPAPPAVMPTHKLTILPKPIPSPLHPRRRSVPSMTMGLGVYCPNFGSPSLPYGRWCAAQIHLGWENAFGNMHLDGLVGDVMRGGVKVGIELGSMFMQLGPPRSRAALAIRGNFDFLVARLGEPVPGRADDGLLGFSNTYGPHFSIALNPRATFDVRAAVGWAVAGFFNGGGVDSPAYALVCEGWLGMRFAP